ncbi:MULTISPECIES: hypothetical protein [unclassified Kitasatospora]
MSEDIKIGNWLLSQDADGNLVIRNGSAVFSFTKDGRIAGKHGDFVEEDTIIYLKNEVRGNGYLNATSHGDGDHPSGFNGWAFWMSGPDDESKLRILKKPQ